MSKVLTFDTKDITPDEKMDFWLDVVRLNYTDLVLQLPKNIPFDAKISVSGKSGIIKAKIVCSQHSIKIEKKGINSEDTQFISITHILSGKCIIRDKSTDTVLKPGDTILQDINAPRISYFPGSAELEVVKIPVNLLSSRIRSIHNVFGTVFESNNSLIDIAGRTINEYFNENRSGVLIPMTGIMLDLIALAFSQNKTAQPEILGMAKIRVLWAQTEIKERIRDPNLSIKYLADKQGVSMRLLQRLFAQQGYNISDYILEQRLQRCYEYLISPMHAKKTITEICLHWGFNDPANFSRVFKRAYGVSPRELKYRERI